MFGIADLINELDENVIRPIICHRYADTPNSIPTPPKLILLTGCSDCPEACSVLVNELRRGKSNKRGDVYYNNLCVKYLEWTNREYTCVPSPLPGIFETAKNGEMTVLVIPQLSSFCPAAANDVRRRYYNPPEGSTMTNQLLEALDGIPAGKILVVGITERESKCHPDLLKRVEFKYHLDKPDEEARREIILGTLEEERAELTPAALINKLVYATRGHSRAEVMSAINGALRQARSRMRERQVNGNPQTVMTVVFGDWARYLDLVMDDRILQAARHGEEQRLFPYPVHVLPPRVLEQPNLQRAIEEMQLAAQMVGVDVVDGNGQAGEIGNEPEEEIEDEGDVEDNLEFEEEDSENLDLEEEDDFDDEEDYYEEDYDY